MGWQQLKGAVAESAPTRSDKLAHVEAERMRTVLSVVMERMHEEKNTTLQHPNYFSLSGSSAEHTLFLVLGGGSECWAR